MTKNLINNLDELENEPTFIKNGSTTGAGNREEENQRFNNAFNAIVKEMNVPKDKVDDLRTKAHQSLGTTGTSYEDIQKHVKEAYRGS